MPPEDRPTAPSALKYAWLVGVNGGNEDRRGDHDETTHGQGERTWSGKSGIKIAAHAKRNKGGERNLITQDGTNCMPGDVAIGMNPRSQGGSDSNTPKSILGTFVMALLDVVSVAS
ncbi:hypothetical protein HOY80DRAFT_1033699 [Tuber brumale]|nr:hypothetical protein HOY80DRAFT_1033699 [Tuber brumale]